MTLFISIAKWRQVVHACRSLTDAGPSQHCSQTQDITCAYGRPEHSE